MAELRVLVCDDDADMLELMIRRLDKMGFKPDRAGDGGIARALIKENLYDLIVTDIYMPEATGLELLQLAKQRDPQVQVVIVTASATLDNAIHALNHGAFGYLSKPFDHLSVFDTTVSRALEFRRLSLANRRMAEAQKMRGDMLEDEVAKRVGQLREKQQGLLDLLNCLQDGIVVVEEGGKLLMTSPAAEQWLARERRSDQRPISEFLGQVHSEWAESSGYAQLGEDSLRLLSMDYPHPNGKKRKAVIIRRAEEEAKESAGPGTLAVQSLTAVKQGLAWMFRQDLSDPMRQQIMQLANHISLLDQLTRGRGEAPAPTPAELPEHLRHNSSLHEPEAATVTMLWGTGSQADRAIGAVPVKRP
jgi:DNA-binding response OmpR family regulator